MKRISLDNIYYQAVQYWKSNQHCVNISLFTKHFLESSDGTKEDL